MDGQETLEGAGAQAEGSSEEPAEVGAEGSSE